MGICDKGEYNNGGISFGDSCILLVGVGVSDNIICFNVCKWFFSIYVLYKN